MADINTDELKAKAQEALEGAGKAAQGAFDAATCPAPLKSFLEGYAAEIRQHTPFPDALFAALTVQCKPGILVIGCIMDPEGLSIHTGTCLVKVGNRRTGNTLPDRFKDIIQGGGTAAHHRADRSCSDGDVKYTAQYFMNAVNAHSADCIQRNDQGLEVLPVLHCRPDVFRKIAAVSPSRQGAAYFEDIVGSDKFCEYLGDSVVIDAYGQTIASCVSGKEGIAVAELDMDALLRFRKKFPVLDDADEWPL